MVIIDLLRYNCCTRGLNYFIFYCLQQTGDKDKDCQVNKSIYDLLSDILYYDLKGNSIPSVTIDKVNSSSFMALVELNKFSFILNEFPLLKFVQKVPGQGRGDLLL
jgi:hypothetical protein